MITYKDLISQEWKSFARQPNASNAFVAVSLRLVLLLLLGIYCAGTGIFLSIGLKQTQPHSSPFLMVNNLIVFYLCVDLFIRFFLQNIPTGIITPYLPLNIPRGKIANYLLVKSLISIPTYCGIVLWGTFSIFCREGGFPWFILIVLLLLINSFLMTLLKSSFETGIKGILTAIALIECLVAAEYFRYFSVGRMLGSLLSHTLRQPIFFLYPIFILAALILFTMREIKDVMYKETTTRQLHASKTNRSESTFYSFEWRQFWRNKRSRIAYFMSFVGSSGMLIQTLLIKDTETRLMVHLMLLFVIALITMSTSLVWVPLTFSRESVFLWQTFNNSVFHGKRFY
jgi:Family of unknown function (DUF5687)